MQSSTRAPHTQISKLFSTIPLKAVAPPATKAVGKYKKRKIPAAIREAVWIKQCGRVFEHKCLTSWCQNTITVFDFQCGHNIPESKGGTLAITNLYPLCARCNVSMGDRYTIEEWHAIQPVLGLESSTIPPVQAKRTWWQFFSCVMPAGKPPPPHQPASPSRPAIR